MTERVTLSLSDDAANFLRASAQAVTGGNVSAYVERLAREQKVRESVASYVRWQELHPAYAEDAAAEAEAAATERGAA